MIIALEFPMPPYYAAAAANDHEPHAKHQAWPLKLLDDLVPGAHRASERRRGGIISLAERGRGRGNGMRATASLEKGFGGTFCFHVYRRQRQPGEDEDESKVRMVLQQGDWSNVWLLVLPDLLTEWEFGGSKEELAILINL